MEGHSIKYCLNRQKAPMYKSQDNLENLNGYDFHEKNAIAKSTFDFMSAKMRLKEGI